MIIRVDPNDLMTGRNNQNHGDHDRLTMLQTGWTGCGCAGGR